MSRLDHVDMPAFLSAHDSRKQVISVHFNPFKSLHTGENWNPILKDPPFELSMPVPWAPDAYYLSSRPSFTLDPFFHAGCYYVQEASGMFLAFALKQVLDSNRNYRVLDLCAAPGGKSTLIQSLLPADSLLVSNETIKTRVPILAQNMTKWGGLNSVVSSNDPAHFKNLPGFFDVILVDAPCSGSGLFRKDPEAVEEWNTGHVHLCSQRQQRILADAWDCLKEDGVLIYSTCSYSKEENEDVLDSVFQQFSCETVPVEPDPDWNIVSTVSDRAGAHGYRFYPDKLDGEGFFISVLRKKKTLGEGGRAARFARQKKPATGISRQATELIKPWIHLDSIQLLSIEESFHAIPVDMQDDLEILRNCLYLKKAGVRIGKAGDRQWIPDHELALASFLNRNIPRMQLGKEDALRYLSGETTGFGGEERGWQLMSFEGQQLGWAKLLNNRLNNYYPKSWRIRQ